MKYLHFRNGTHHFAISQEEVIKILPYAPGWKVWRAPAYCDVIFEDEQQLYAQMNPELLYFQTDHHEYHYLIITNWLDDSCALCVEDVSFLEQIHDAAWRQSKQNSTLWYAKGAVDIYLVNASIIQEMEKIT